MDCTALELINVLIVDDDAISRTLLQDIVGVLGGRIHLACDGQEALQVAARIHFDLVLMDLAMPRMDGEAATRSLRSLGVRCPIIAVTAYAPWRHASERAQYGFDGLIEKPISIAAIASALETARSRAFGAAGRLASGAQGFGAQL
jgi:CheY-like chemotaxis protein